VTGRTNSNVIKRVSSDAEPKRFQCKVT
jgi:hypothetical protein